MHSYLNIPRSHTTPFCVSDYDIHLLVIVIYSADLDVTHNHSLGNNRYFNTLHYTADIDQSNV